MPNFKVINPDTPEEIDLVQDIPLVDEETGSDQIDAEGNILVKRYITRTVNLNGINDVKNSLPQIKENAKNLKDLYDYSHSVNTDQQNQILENSSKITELLTDTTALEVTVTELENKIKGIQGIDIDEVKADLDALKQSAYLITGGTLKGDISVQTPHTATVTLTPSESLSFASFSCNNDVLDCTTTWGKLFKQSEEGGFFYGLSSTALADKNGKELTNYISDIMGSNAQLTFIKGDGTSQVISINNVISATKATKATNADNATNLGGYPATDYIRSVNGINADTNGNVQLGNLVKSVNGVEANENGDVVLETASSGVGFPDYNAGITLATNGSLTEIPSNGWVYMAWSTNGKSTGCSFGIYTDKTNYPNNKLCDYTYGFSTSAWASDHANVSVLIPIKKGQAVLLNVGGNTTGLKFVFYPFEQ